MKAFKFGDNQKKERKKGDFMERNFSMRRKKSILPKVTAVIFILALIAVAVYVFYPRKNEIPVTNAPVAARSEIILNDDSVTKIKTLYKCGHEKNETKRTESELAGKRRQDVEILRPEWKITKFTREEVDAEILKNIDCDKHFILELTGNELRVYKSNDKDRIIRKKQINTQVLSKEEIDSLLSGIKTDSEFEMLEIMESFSE